MTWIVDTGPLIALLVARDRHHAWAVEQSRHAPPTVSTCEAVVSETMFLLKRAGNDGAPLFALMEAGFLRCDFALQEEHRSIRTLMRRYGTLPMSLADACLVRMCEATTGAVVWTLDRDFTVYRRHGRQTLALIAPW